MKHTTSSLFVNRLTTMKILLIIHILFITFISIDAAAGNLQGTYKPDGKCVPSSTCCCSTGVTTISSQPPNDGVNVSGDLDGGSGCRGFASLGAVFQVGYFICITGL